MDSSFSRNLSDPSAGGGRHLRVDELAVDEPQLDAGIAPPAADREGGSQGGPRERQRAKGDAYRRARGTTDLYGNHRRVCPMVHTRNMNKCYAP